MLCFATNYSVKYILMASGPPMIIFDHWQATSTTRLGLNVILAFIFFRYNKLIIICLSRKNRHQTQRRFELMLRLFRAVEATVLLTAPSHLIGRGNSVINAPSSSSCAQLSFAFRSPQVLKKMYFCET